MHMGGSTPRRGPAFSSPVASFLPWSSFTASLRGGLPGFASIEKLTPAPENAGQSATDACEA